MKVAFVGGRGLYSNYGGVENAIRELSFRLERKNDLNLHVYGCGIDEEQSIGSSCTSVNMHSIFYRLGGQNLYMLACLIHSVLILRPSTVIVFASGPNLFVPIWKLFGVKVISSLRAIDSERGKWSRFQKLILKMGEYFAVRYSDVFTSNSKNILNRYEYLRSDGIFIPNGINRSKEKLQVSLPFSHSEDFILYAGRLDPVKRIDVLINAYLKMKCRNSTWLVIAGGMCKDPKYEKYLKSISSNKIVFLGHISQEEVNYLMIKAKIFVLPSAIEGMSNSLLSAMSLGCCSIVSDIPENTDLIDNFESIFPLDDPLLLAEKVDYLISNEDVLKSVSAHQLKRSKIYNWNISAQKIYAELVK